MKEPGCQVISGAPTVLSNSLANFIPLMGSNYLYSIYSKEPYKFGIFLALSRDNTPTKISGKFEGSYITL